MKLSTASTLLLAIASSAALLPERALEGGGRKGRKDSKKHLDALEEMCSVFQVFDNFVRFNQDTNIPGIPWEEACDEFEPVDYLLCPSRKVVQDICEHPRPDFNPVVKHNYCEPLFSLMEDDWRKVNCTKYCVNYVSVDRGGCCDFYCDAS